MNSSLDPDAVRAKKRFRLPERIKQQNEEIFRRKLDRALPPAAKRKAKETPEASTLKLAAIWLAILAIVFLGIWYGIRPPR